MASVGPQWGAFIERDPQRQQANMADIVRWTAEGKLSAHVHAVYPLAETPQALTAIAERKVMGKAILRPQPTGVRTRQPYSSANWQTVLAING